MADRAERRRDRRSAGQTTWNLTLHQRANCPDALDAYAAVLSEGDVVYGGGTPLGRFSGLVIERYQLLAILIDGKPTHPHHVDVPLGKWWFLKPGDEAERWDPDALEWARATVARVDRGPQECLYYFEGVPRAFDDEDVRLPADFPQPGHSRRLDWDVWNPGYGPGRGELLARLEDDPVVSAKWAAVFATVEDRVRKECAQFLRDDVGFDHTRQPWLVDALTGLIAQKWLRT